MAAVELRGVSKTYPGGHVALVHIDLDVVDGELMVVVGPSGCGKSTVLRLVAGLERANAGRVLIGGVDVTDVPPHRRDIAMVFQNYALYPHKSVRDNLAFGLKMARAPRDEIARRIEEIAAMLELDALLDRKPAQLSGGQRQRVALGRALARRPKAFLLDEPLSNLDATLRLSTRAELARIHQRFGITTLYVTHDQQEALTLGARIAVMRAGRIEQLGPPLDVFHRPATRFVGQFIGSPPMNLFNCELRVDAGVVHARHALFDLKLSSDVEGVDLPNSADLGIRPHDLEPVGQSARSAAPANAPADADEGQFRGEAEVVELLGNETIVHVLAGRDRFTAALKRDARIRPGDQLAFTVASDRVHLFDKRTGARVELTASR